jgi:hypothetical protein
MEKYENNSVAGEEDTHYIDLVQDGKVAHSCEHGDHAADSIMWRKLCCIAEQLLASQEGLCSMQLCYSQLAISTHIF